MAWSLISVTENTVPRLIALKLSDDGSFDLVIRRAMDKVSPPVAVLAAPATPAPISTIARRPDCHLVEVMEQQVGWTLQEALPEGIRMLAHRDATVLSRLSEVKTRCRRAGQGATVWKGSGRLVRLKRGARRPWPWRKS